MANFTDAPPPRAANLDIGPVHVQNRMRRFGTRPSRFANADADTHGNNKSKSNVNSSTSKRDTSSPPSRFQTDSNHRKERRDSSPSPSSRHDSKCNKDNSHSHSHSHSRSPPPPSSNGQDHSSKSKPHTSRRSRFDHSQIRDSHRHDRTSSHTHTHTDSRFDRKYKPSTYNRDNALASVTTRKKRPSATVTPTQSDFDTMHPAKRFCARWCDVVDRLSMQHGEEVDPHRLAQRQKQIDYGKNTIAYDRFIELCPRHSRRRGHPMTPVVNQVCSKRSFEGQVINWRKAVYAYVDNLHDAQKPQRDEDPCQVDTGTLAQSYNVDAVEQAAEKKKGEDDGKAKEKKKKNGKNENGNSIKLVTEQSKELGGEREESIESLQPSSERTCTGLGGDQDHEPGGEQQGDDKDEVEERTEEQIPVDMEMDIDFDCAELDDIELDDQGNVLPSIEYPPNSVPSVSSDKRKEGDNKSDSQEAEAAASIFSDF